jgi:hypothetical protein
MFALKPAYLIGVTLSFASMVATGKVCVLSIQGNTGSVEAPALSNLVSFKTCDGEPKSQLPTVSKTGSMLDEQSGQLNELIRNEKVQVVQCYVSLLPIRLVGPSAPQVSMPMQQICILSDQSTQPGSTQSSVETNRPRNSAPVPAPEKNIGGVL